MKAKMKNNAPTMDIKKQLQDIEQEFQSLEQEATSLRQRLQAIQIKQLELRGAYQALSLHVEKKVVEEPVAKPKRKKATKK